MLRTKPTLLSLLLLLFAPNYVSSFNFGNLLYSLNICSGPNHFCPEPDCRHEHKHHLCQWYDCGSYSSRSLKEGSGLCTFFGSLTACGGDELCIDACKHLNKGACPSCYNYDSENGVCMDTNNSNTDEYGYYQNTDTNNSNTDEYGYYQNTSISNSGANQSKWQASIFSKNLMWYLTVGGIVGGIAFAFVVRHNRVIDGGLSDHLNPGGKGLVRERMEKVEAGTADEIKQTEERTYFKHTVVKATVV